jgi:hypothetical protein
MVGETSAARTGPEATSRRKVRWLPGIIFVVVGIGLLIATIVLHQRTQAFLGRAKSADGVIVDMRYGSQHPAVEFALPSGERVKFWAGGWLSGHRLHERVAVLYEPAAPAQTAQLHEPGALWFSTRITGFLGIGQLVVGLLAMFVRTRST